MTLAGIYGLVFLALGSPAVPARRDTLDPGLSDLPLIEIPVTARHGTLAVLLTGDGTASSGTISPRGSATTSSSSAILAAATWCHSWYHGCRRSCGHVSPWSP
jgi:hypothetical protein